MLTNSLILILLPRSLFPLSYGSSDTYWFDSPLTNYPMLTNSRIILTLLPRSLFPLSYGSSFLQARPTPLLKVSYLPASLLCREVTRFVRWVLSHLACHKQCGPEGERCLRALGPVFRSLRYGGLVSPQIKDWLSMFQVPTIFPGCSKSSAENKPFSLKFN